jgi:hypothetical protein
VIRRLLVLGAIAWIARWAVLLAASEIERRRRQ